MGKQLWKPGNMLYPLPVVMVSVADKEGKSNIITIAWAGTICSNLKSDGKPVVIHGDVDYETGLRKIGGILADGADVGCGSVINPGTVIGKNTSVYPLTSLRGVYPADCIVKATNTVVKREER